LQAPKILQPFVFKGFFILRLIDYNPEKLGNDSYRQQDYYRLLGEADKQADCSAFIEFLLQSIQESLHEAIASQNITASKKTPVKVRATTETQILELLRSRPELSPFEVAATIGRSLRAVERAAAKLKAENRLIYEGSKKMANGRFYPEVTSILSSLEINSRCRNVSAFCFHKK